MIAKIDINKHKIIYCSHCERDIVICGTCGNNTCNGGYGEVDGKRCIDCESAYKIFESIK